MAADRKKIIDGLSEMRRVCKETEMCGRCEIASICTRVDEAINEHEEIDPSKIILSEDDY